MTLFRRFPALVMAVLLALAVGIVPAPTQLLAAPLAQGSDPKVLGYYESALIPGKEGAPDLVVGLILYEDGTAEVISDYQNDEDVITEVGTWVDNGDSTVTLTVTGTTDADYAAPIDLVFEVAEDGSLVVPGAANGAFGEEGLTLAPTALGNSDAILAQIPSNALVYQSGVMPAASSPGLQLTLAIFDDGSLTMVSDYLNEGEIVVEVGTWTEGEDGSLVISLTGQVENGKGTLTEYEQALEFVFTVNDDGSLALVDEGGALFGEAGLTLLPVEATGEATEEGATGEAVAEEEAAEATAESAITDTVAATDTVILTDTVDITDAEEVTDTVETTDTVAAETEPETEPATDSMTETVSATGTMTLAGGYVSELLPTDDGGTFLVGVFYDDGTVLVSTYALNGDLPILEVGSWAPNVDGTYTITATGTVEEEYDAPVEIEFTVDEDGVISISGVSLYPLGAPELTDTQPATDESATGEPNLLAKFESDLITDTIDLTHTLTLSIFDDFSVELTTDYPDSGDVRTEVGTWDINEADDQVTVTLTGDDEGAYDEPVEWLFDVATDETLVLANDDEGYYGEDGLILLPVEVKDDALLEGEAEADTDAAALEGVQVFQSEVLPAASSPGLQLTLGLLDDGSAALDYDYLNGEEVVTNTGEWVDNGDGTLTITLTEGPTGTLELPVELTLELDDAGNLIITDASEESLGLLDVTLAPITLE